MKRIAVLLLLLFAIGCATDDDFNEPRRGRGGDRGDGGDYQPRPAMAAGELLPPAWWWRDPQISVAVALTSDQLLSLDRISQEQSEEIAKLERDSMVAARDLRQVVDASQPSTADITGAGQRLRGIRDALFDRRLQLFAAERTLLTQKQWDALQEALRASRNRPDRGNRGGYGGRGGRGGMGGRGRFPG